MHLKKITVILFLSVLVVFFEFCSKDKATIDAGTNTTATSPNLPATPFNYNINYPSHLITAMNQQDNTPADNPITNDGATLGRVLFYDKNLSKNNSISCGSCHKASTSFTDNVRLSTGFDGGLT